MCVLELSKNLIKFLKDISELFMSRTGISLNFQSQANLCTIIVLIIYYADNCRFVCGRGAGILAYLCHNTAMLLLKQIDIEMKY